MQSPTSDATVTAYRPLLPANKQRLRDGHSLAHNTLQLLGIRLHDAMDLPLHVLTL